MLKDLALSKTEWSLVAVLILISVVTFVYQWRTKRPTWLYRLPAYKSTDNPAPAITKRNGNGQAYLKERQPEGIAGERLYIGIAHCGRLATRWKEHRGLIGPTLGRPKSWAHLVLWRFPLPATKNHKWYKRFPSVELLWSRDAAELAETLAIQTEKPIYNIMKTAVKPTAGVGE